MSTAPNCPRLAQARRQVAPKPNGGGFLLERFLTAVPPVIINANSQHSRPDQIQIQQYRDRLRAVLLLCTETRKGELERVIPAHAELAQERKS